MEYFISIDSLEKIVHGAFSEGMRYGELRVMGHEGANEFRAKAFVNILSNAKSLMLEDSRAKEDRNYWAKKV